MQRTEEARCLRKRWKPKEDQRLCYLMDRYGDPAIWKFLAKDPSLLPGRTPKNCRERWINHLAPDARNKDPWTDEESRIIVEMVSSMGRRWTTIAERLPGRSPSAVANHFRLHLEAKGDIPGPSSPLSGVAETASSSSRSPLPTADAVFSGSESVEARSEKRKRPTLAPVIPAPSTNFENVSHRPGDVSNPTSIQLADFMIHGCRIADRPASSSDAVSAHRLPPLVQDGDMDRPFPSMNISSVSYPSSNRRPFPTAQVHGPKLDGSESDYAHCSAQTARSTIRMFDGYPATVPHRQVALMTDSATESDDSAEESSRADPRSSKRVAGNTVAREELPPLTTLFRGVPIRSLCN